MDPLIYTDATHRDLGRKFAYTADMEVGNSGNRLEVTVDLENRLPGAARSLLYREGSEFGGIIDEIGADTTSSRKKKAIYAGRTWTGILARKILMPPANKTHLAYQGEANAGLLWLINRMGLSDLFTAKTTSSDIYINYQFDRFVDAYTGIRKMLATSDAKLKLSWENDRVVLWAEPIMDYTATREIDSDRMTFSVNKVYRPVNHLVCLGTGEGLDRIVLHFYADENGNAVNSQGNPLPQSLFGVDEVMEEYDYSNAEYDELYEKGLEKIKEMQNVDTCDADFQSDKEYDIGDLVGVREKKTGIVISAPIVSKAFVVDARGSKVTYAVGQTVSQSSLSGRSESSGGGGGTVIAGYGLSKTGNTLNAEVGLQELAETEDIAMDAYSVASNTQAALGAVERIANAAVQTVGATSPLAASRTGNDITLTHENSGVTAGSAGAASELTEPGFGDTYNVGPRVSANAKGHVTNLEGRRSKIPDFLATQEARGLMDPIDKTKLDGIAEGANAYTLPAATNEAIGGVKPDGVTVTVSSDGTLTAQQGGAASFLAAHPVQSYFWTENPADPGGLYGGTWERKPWQWGYLWLRLS